MTDAKVIDNTKPGKPSKVKRLVLDLVTNPAPRNWTVVLLIVQAFMAGNMVLTYRLTKEDEPQPKPITREEADARDVNLMEYILDVETDTVIPRQPASSQPRRERIVRRPGLAKINRPLELNVPAGTIVPAHLIRAEKNGDVLATIAEPTATIDRHRLPKGLVLKGKASKSNRRLYLSFDEAVSKERGTASISAVGLDPNDRKPGLVFESLLNSVSRDLATAGGTFLSGYGKGLQQERSYGLFSSTKPNPKSALLQSLGDVVSSHTDELAPAGTEVDLTGSKFLIKFL